VDSPVTEAPGSVEPAQKSSYGQILKSSSMIGGSMAISLALGMVRTKVLAVLLGPAGTGLFGMYGAITNIVQLIFGMGLNISGVRQVAEATATNDQTRIALVSITLRRMALSLGLLGAVLLALLSQPIARFTFGDANRWKEVALLGFVVLFGSMSAAQIALLQGVRRIRDMAKANVVGALFATVIGIPLVCVFKTQGVIYYVIAVAGAACFVSWRIARSIGLIRVFNDAPRLLQILQEGRCLVKHGFFFMLSAAAIGISDYMVKVSITRHIGLMAVGSYQAAWSLSFLSIGVVSQALGSDFYPRLSAASGNDRQCNQLLNEQIQVSLLMAIPSILAGIVLAPQIILFFYAKGFADAVILLRLQMVGILLAVIFIPFSYLLLAKGKTVIYLLSTITTNLTFVLIADYGLPVWGLPICGVAFSLHTLLALVIGCIMAYKLVGFVLFPLTKKYGLACGVFMLLGLGVVRLGGWATVIAGLLLVLSVSLYCLRELISLVGWQKLPLPLRRLGLFLTRNG
jgi:PST family polysaccharide transporter